MVIERFNNAAEVLYFLGGFYVLYMAYKVIKSKQLKIDFKLKFKDLIIILILSPKIWLLFPVGAAIAINLTDNLLVNATIFATIMFITSNILFFLYAFVGRFGGKILRDNFSYLTSIMLVFFAIFLFFEVL